MRPLSALGTLLGLRLATGTASAAWRFQSSISGGAASNSFSGKQNVISTGSPFWVPGAHSVTCPATRDMIVAGPFRKTVFPSKSTRFPGTAYCFPLDASEEPSGFSHQTSILGARLEPIMGPPVGHPRKDAGGRDLS